MLPLPPVPGDAVQQQEGGNGFTGLLQHVRDGVLGPWGFMGSPYPNYGGHGAGGVDATQMPIPPVSGGPQQAQDTAPGGCGLHGGQVQGPERRQGHGQDQGGTTSLEKGMVTAAGIPTSGAPQWYAGMSGPCFPAFLLRV